MDATFKSLLSVLDQEAVLINTQKARESDFIRHETQETYTPTSEKLVKLIQNGFGCERQRVYDIISLLHTEPLPPLPTTVFPDKKYAVPGTIIVILVGYDGHNYPLNEPIFTINQENGVTFKGFKGNNFHVTSGAASGGWRYATDEEVFYFFHNVTVSK
jgi:hypothetical protein